MLELVQVIVLNLARLNKFLFGRSLCWLDTGKNENLQRVKSVSRWQVEEAMPYSSESTDWFFIWKWPVHTLEKEMAPHSSIFAWKIPWTEETGGLQSMVLQRVGHDCS